MDTVAVTIAVPLVGDAIAVEIAVWTIKAYLVLWAVPTTPQRKRQARRQSQGSTAEG